MVTKLFPKEKKSLDDCRLFGLNQVGLVHLVGAYSGDFPLVMVCAAIPSLSNPVFYSFSGEKENSPILHFSIDFLPFSSS